MIITEEKALERILSYGFCDTAIPISIHQSTGDEPEITVLPSIKKVAAKLERDFADKLFSKEAHSFLRENIRPFMDTIGFLDNRQSRKISLVMSRNESIVPSPTSAIRLTDKSTYSKNLTTVPMRDLLELGHIVCAVMVDSSIVSVAYTDLPPDGKAVEVGVETAPAYRNRGYAKDALTKLISELDRIDTVPIYICSQSNTASMRLAKSLGFSTQAMEYNYIFRRK